MKWLPVVLILAGCTAHQESRITSKEAPPSAPQALPLGSPRCDLQRDMEAAEAAEDAATQARVDAQLRWLWEHDPELREVLSKPLPGKQ
jgi:hypothetical protein